MGLVQVERRTKMWIKSNINRAYNAEMNNLLTEAHLTSVFRNDETVYAFMSGRYSTLKLRFGIALTVSEEWELARLFNNEAQIDRLFAGVETNTQHTWIDDPAEREVRYNAMAKRLGDALRYTKWGGKLERDHLRELRDTKRSAYAELTGDRNFLWYRG